MTIASPAAASVRHADRFFIGGEWVKPSSESTIDVVDSTNEEVFLTVAEAQADDMARAVGAARNAFDNGPWAALSHQERAGYLRAIAAGLRERANDLSQVWPRESGVLYALSSSVASEAAAVFEYYAGLAGTYAWEERATPTMGNFGLLVREPVGVVGAIIPWNGPLQLISYKIAPALLAGCTVILKSSPEAPAEGLVISEIAESIGLPAGVLNVVTADRAVSELLVRDPRVDKITFTGSTAAGRRIASICGERIARVTLELGGKSAAVVMDDADIASTAATLAGAECLLAGQVCSSLTRIVVSRSRHDELLEALAAAFGAKKAGDPFDASSDLGPLVAQRQVDRVNGYIEKGQSEGATLAAGGPGRPADVDKGFYVQPTVFGNVPNSATIAQEEIFGPVLSVIPADNEQDAIKTANDTIYGLNSSVFTNDVDKARDVARQLRAGTVGHNSFQSDFGIAFGGFKQSGLGREGGTEGLHPFLETKTVILDEAPAKYRS